jgi:four helix bundle suffix protein
MSSVSLVPTHGGYRRLKSFQVAGLVYDVTVRFCDRHNDRRSRTHDQMVLAARSGVQNIAEGSQASATSRKMELKLTNVARASLEELRLDYEDFLRQHGLACWARGDPLRAELVARRLQTPDQVAQWVGEVHQRGRHSDGRHGHHGHDGHHGHHGHHGHDGQPSSPGNKPSGAGPSIESIRSISSTQSTRSCPEIAANAALVLIGVAIALLGRQIAAQAAAFERDGGFTERLYKVRTGKRGC